MEIGEWWLDLKWRIGRCFWKCTNFIIEKFAKKIELKCSQQQQKKRNDRGINEFNDGTSSTMYIAILLYLPIIHQ